MMDTSSIREQVATVARLRADTAEATAQLDAERSAWNAEHKPLIDQVAAYRRDLEAAEKALREAAVARYWSHADKAPAPGVGIKVYTKCDYEPDKALAWARQHDLCLVLDVRAFERIAKAGGISCVTLRDEPVATLAADLGAALELEAAFSGEAPACR